MAMPDLIRRAAERLGASAPNFAGPRETIAPIDPVVQDQPAVQDRLAAQEQPAAPVVRRASKQVAIDLEKLREEGYITPDLQTTVLADEFRLIKRPLLLKAFNSEGKSGEANHVLMVTSARPGEGKTFVSLNLAMSMASEQNLNVLLIDADAKRGTLSNLLGLSSHKGLIDLLVEKNLDLSDVILRTNVSNLSFIPAGGPHPQSTELLAGKRMRQLVDDIAHRYSDRVVIFDTPPVLASTEADVLALHVGQALFVVEADQTSRRSAEEALSHIKPCKNVHLVLNKRRAWIGQAQFGTYYGYPAR